MFQDKADTGTAGVLGARGSPPGISLPRQCCTPSRDRTYDAESEKESAKVLSIVHHIQEQSQQQKNGKLRGSKRAKRKSS